MLNRFLAAVVIVLAFAAAPVLAEQKATDGIRDDRIKTFEYFADDVYWIDAYTGYTVTISFDESERVIEVQSGDTLSWEINQLQFEERLSLKAKEVVDQPTNVTIHTTRRMYSFVVKSHKGGDPKGVGFRYSFKYPEPPQKTVTARSIFEVYRRAADGVNLEYSAAGSKLLRPVQVFDDGVKTYVRLPPRSVRPAVFAMEADGFERTINSGDYLDDGTIVVNGVYSRLVLRNGPYVTCLFNRPLYDATVKDIAPKKPRPRSYSASDVRDGR
ncbi:TrbG/VirB9 family P-type conjugative transfer protein [Pelagibius sp. Alg239-R121]|uniref:TrbG/VirB9 family P-type conjugative transfer protein n=1 Tax=Pelagibius sp. Alg239-R121 TaxID=2993448 RepID=UPI0024A67C77|nr:TrbG/VirB9 family P-type conjugative transfer protein [Pelagibius sp. Alg239-R121]